SCSLLSHDSSFFFLCSSRLCSISFTILFPYTTLFRSLGSLLYSHIHRILVLLQSQLHEQFAMQTSSPSTLLYYMVILVGRARRQDRKSTRLNSSHVSLSYAVFFLKQQIFLFFLFLIFI